MRERSVVTEGGIILDIIISPRLLVVSKRTQSERMASLLDLWSSPGFDSDLLVVHAATSSSQPFTDYNLFTSSRVAIDGFLCEFRGMATPLEDLESRLKWMDPNHIVSSLGGQSYYLTPQTLCSLVNDCINISAVAEPHEKESDYYRSDCQPNSRIVQRDSKLFLVATTDIPVGTELFVSRGLDYWRSMNAQLGFVTHPSNLAIPELPLSSIPSDQLNLFSAPSLLPAGRGKKSIGMGIFTRYNVPPNTILCEYRGPTYPLDDPIQSDKWSSVLEVNNLFWKSSGVDYCSIINDPSLISVYTSNELEQLYDPMSNQQLPLHKGFSQNVYRATNGPKSFVVSSQFIHAGAELFYPYGKSVARR
jgi:hypothetical protein